MSSDPERVSRSDHDEIDVSDAGDVEYWTLTFNTTREDLVAAVGKVGTLAADVRAQLARQPKRDRA